MTHHNNVVTTGHGDIPKQPVRPSAQTLVGALDEAALYISRSTDPEQAREEIDRLINGIAGSPGSQRS